MEILSLAELARRLDLPTSTVDRWIRQGRIPVVRREDGCVFDQRELERWARERKMVFVANAAVAPAPSLDQHELSLPECMRRGGLHQNVPGADRSAALAAAAALTPIPASHHDALAELLLQREELSSTGIGNGVAIPHPRTPIPEVVESPSVTTCFLQRPLDFNAIDDQPVFALFVILSPSTKLHLRLLARLAFVLREQRFTELLASRPTADRMFAAVDELDSASPPIAPR